MLLFDLFDITAWKLKVKTFQQSADNEILTPDGQKIMVGATGDDILLSSRGSNNWKVKDKVELTEF